MEDANWYNGEIVKRHQTKENNFKWSDDDMQKFGAYYYRRETKRSDLSLKDIWKEWVEDQATDDVRERITALRHKGSFGVWKKNESVDFDKHIEDVDFKIHSVLSKNNVEVSVGDYVTLRWRDEVTSGKVSHFTYCEPANIIDIYLEGQTTARTTRHFDIEKAEEKKVLFTTIDRKEIYGGDSYFSVSDDFQLLRTDVANECDGSWLRSFSTKEAAEKWIAHNTKSISFADLENFVRSQEIFRTGDERDVRVLKYPEFVKLEDLLNNFRPK